eukprot:4535682-Pleurochrysis_carterae.AAC.2
MKQRRVNLAMGGVSMSFSRPGLEKRKVAPKGVCAESVRTSACRSNIRGSMPSAALEPRAWQTVYDTSDCRIDNDPRRQPKCAALGRRATAALLWCKRDAGLSAQPFQCAGPRPC